jgi:hypothetical protein
VSGDAATPERLIGVECEVGYLAGNASANSVNLYLNQANWYALPVATPALAISAPANNATVGGTARLYRGQLAGE